MVKWMVVTLLEGFIFGATYGIFYKLMATSEDTWLLENAVWIALLLGLLSVTVTFRSSKLFAESFQEKDPGK